LDVAIFSGGNFNRYRIEEKFTFPKNTKDLFVYFVAIIFPALNKMLFFDRRYEAKMLQLWT
jgi:hypothetical protein